MKIAMPWRSIGLALGALAIAAVPVFLVTSNVRWAFNEPRLYDYSFSRFNVSASTGFPDSELRRAAREIVEYWGSDAELLDIRVDGEPLYTEREIIHMRDVKGLVRGVSWAPVVTGGLVLAYALGGLAVQGRRFLPVLANRALVAGLGSIATLLVLGLALAVAFPLLFRLFHEISFANDFWLLDPNRHNLIRMFPQGFWFEATMFIAAATVLEALALAGAGWAAVRWLRNKELALREEPGEGAEG